MNSINLSSEKKEKKKKIRNDPVTDLRSTVAVIPILDYSKFLLCQARFL